MTQKNNITPVNLNAVNKIPSSITNIPTTVNDIDLAKKLCQIYSSANERNIPCTLTLKKLKNIMKSTHCYYTGVAFDNVHIRSIDRVDNTIGYIDSNLVASDKDFNSKKANLTLEDIDLLYKKVSKFINPKTNVKKSSSSKKSSTTRKTATITTKSSSFKESSKIGIATSKDPKS